MSVKEPNIPLMILPVRSLRVIKRRFFGIGRVVSYPFADLGFNLRRVGLKYGREEYVTAAMFSSGIWAAFIYSLMGSLNFLVSGSMDYSAPLLPTGATYLLVLLVLIYYPKILAGKEAEQTDKDLVYGLRDMLLQVSGGVSLFNAMRVVSRRGYGRVSEEFGRVVRETEAGKDFIGALEELITRTDSKFMKRAVWQLVNAIRAGASVKNALQALVDELLSTKRENIKSYAQELNMFSLIYMLFAVAIPTIGITVLVVLSSFAGFGVTPDLFSMLIVFGFLVQMALIGFIKSRRPGIQV